MFVPSDSSKIYVETTANYGLHIFLKNDLDMNLITST